MQSRSSFLILHEDESLVLIRKPSGWLVHPTPIAPDRETCLNVLERELQTPLYSIHRLDRGTSGVLLFAKTRKVAQSLSVDFEQRQVEKNYLAVVRGWPEGEGVIDKDLPREEHLEFRPAQTAYRLLKTCELPFAVSKQHATSRYALVRARPHTGRRHQIRRHFVSVFHPIIGDRI